MITVEHRPLVRSEFLKPGAEVFIGRDSVYKKMSESEVRAYQTLEPHRAQLLLPPVSITFPRLLESASGNVSRLEKLSSFSDYAPHEYFGHASIYTEKYFEALLKIWDKLRMSIPAHEVSSLDYDKPVRGVVPTISFLESVYTKTPSVSTDLYDLVLNAVHQSQLAIENLALFASHRDPNPNNYSVSFREDEIHAAVIDWETFGLARVGYEEGRFFTYLALSPKKQDAFLSFVTARLSPPEQVYFWRTAATRAFREITLFQSGHYDSRLSVREQQPEQDKTKQQITSAFVSMIERADQEISRILSHELY